MKLSIAILIYIISIIVSNVLYAQTTRNSFDYKSNTEIIWEIEAWKTNIDYLEILSSYHGNAENDSIKFEQVIYAHNIDLNASIQEAIKNFQLIKNQSFQGSQLYRQNRELSFRLDTKRFNGNLSGMFYKIYLTPKTYYFHDGTIEQVNDSNHIIPLLQHIPTNYSKIIDSITFQVNLKYIKTMDTITLNNKKEEYKNGNNYIVINQLEGNNLSYKYDTTLNIPVTEVYNKNGRSIAYYSYYKSNIALHDYSKVKNTQNRIEELISNAIIDSNMNNAQFRNKYEALFQTEIVNFNNSDTNYYKGKFYGDIENVRLWIEKKQTYLTKDITIAVHSGYNYFHHKGQDGFDILDKNGEVQITHDLSLAQITSNYFLNGDDKYYYFDAEQKTISLLSYLDVSLVFGEFVMIQHRYEDKQVELKNNNKSFGFYDEIKRYNNAAIGISENQKILIDQYQNVHKLNVDSISDINNDFMTFSKNNKYGFMDKNGKIIIPAVYNSSTHFEKYTEYLPEDLLFPVLKKDKWGFVNKDNKTIIPFEYDEVTTFSHGIALVRKNNEGFLINTKNTIVSLKAKEGIYRLDNNSRQRSYRIGNKWYSSLGKEY